MITVGKPERILEHPTNIIKMKDFWFMISVKHRLLMVAIVALWFLCPLPQPSAIKTVHVERSGSPSFTVVEERIVCVRMSEEILLRAFPRLSAGRVQIDFLDLDEKVIAAPFILTEDKRDSLTLVTDDGFPPGRTFRLRCTEQGVVGSYRLLIWQPWNITLGQRYIAVVSILAVGLVVMTGLGVFGIGGTGIRRLRASFGWFLFLASFWLAYPLAHEAGHVLALRIFDAWDPAGTSMLPVGGQLPHVSVNADTKLTPWQISVVAAAGPLLPTLLGYVSFALGMSPFGHRRRSQDPRVNIGWSLLTLILVFPQAVPASMFFPSAVPDGDYSLFIQNIAMPLWVAYSATVVVAVINLVITVWLVKSYVLRIRAARRELSSGSPNG